MRVEREETKMSLGDFANLLHSSILALEKSIQEKMGKEHIILTSHAAKYIAAIEKAKGSRMFSGGSLDEAIKNLIDFASGSDYLDKLEVKKLKDE